MSNKKVIYLSGPITGIPDYKECFEKAEEILTELGYTVLTPSRLPGGMDNAQYMRIDLAMIDSADVVVFLSGWSVSLGAKLENDYCCYIEKPFTFMHPYRDNSVETTRQVLREVLGE